MKGDGGAMEVGEGVVGGGSAEGAPGLLPPCPHLCQEEVEGLASLAGGGVGQSML